MQSEHPPIYYVLQSRKFWSAVVGFLAIVIVAWRSGAALDPNTVVNAILGIVAAYMGATAWEDGKRNEAAAVIAAAPVTTVSTPGGSDVTVTAPTDAAPVIVRPQPVGDDATPMPTQPVVGNMVGLK